jgi:hypothetical protein
MKIWLRIRLVVALMAVLFTATACLGRFAAFNELSRWNQQIHEDRWVNEIVFIALVIVPVYEVALLADVLIFNSVEFWSGENPINESGNRLDRHYQKTAKRGSMEIVQRFFDTGTRRSMVVDRYDTGRLAETMVLFKESGQPEYLGLVVAGNAEVSVFSIVPEPEGPILTRFRNGGSPLVTSFRESSLERMTMDIARILQTRQERVAYAH